MSSSSSSSHDYWTTTINQVVVSGNNGNIIPFTWIAESGIPLDLGNDANIYFKIESASENIINYDAVINRDNSALLEINDASLTTYLVEDDNGKYQHDSLTHVDVIVDDNWGAKQARIRTDVDGYEFEDVESAYLIPKFTWENNQIELDVSDYIGNLWVGTENGNLLNVQYGDGAVSIFEQFDLDSQINGVSFSDIDNRMFVTTSSNLYSYSVSHYVDSNASSQLLVEENINRGILNSYIDGYIWSIRAYDGIVSKLDADDFSVINSYSGLDAPNKVVWSDYHNTVFVSGSYILWKLVNGEFIIVYNVNTHKIVDFDISPTGEIIILLNGDTDRIRVLKNDLYGFVTDREIKDVSLRFCKYCENNVFYILGEYDTTSAVYAARHYFYNYNQNVLQAVDIQDSAIFTTTTTTIGSTINPIQITYPNGSEQLKRGDTYDITWISSKGIGDEVKIELYKRGLFDRIIEEKTGNSGVYAWSIPSDLREGDDYKIAITWLAASSDPANTDFSNANFSILDTIPTTTTTTSTIASEKAVGVLYDEFSKNIIVVLESGLMGYIGINNKIFYGLFDIGYSMIKSVGIRNDLIREVDKFVAQLKARVIVGSQEGWNDKWDSGVIDTKLTSMFYGGGNNLKSGQKYYFGVQVYSEDNGWSEIQTKEFIMPR